MEIQAKVVNVNDLSPEFTVFCETYFSQNTTKWYRNATGTDTKLIATKPTKISSW